ncbi:hypothetical protein M5K25_013721 [Dendrobium thyrsiflorum]|uniref:Reverse transcriptase domain-containing protein n=1 Tax=Dendrobium thyrsiflorum TaxID=117978 RepID=A0ABD0V1L1_DENTH
MEKVISYLEANISPGLDEISYSFIKFYWPIIKEDVWNAINSFFTFGYADDIIIFSEAKHKSVKKISKIMNDYNKWSSQKVKVQKSSILFGKSIGRIRIVALSRILDFLRL